MSEVAFNSRAPLVLWLYHMLAKLHRNHVSIFKTKCDKCINCKCILYNYALHKQITSFYIITSHKLIILVTWHIRICPLGFCGAQQVPEVVPTPRLRQSCALSSVRRNAGDGALLQQLWCCQCTVFQQQRLCLWSPVSGCRWHLQQSICRQWSQLLYTINSRSPSTLNDICCLLKCEIK